MSVIFLMAPSRLRSYRKRSTSFLAPPLQYHLPGAHIHDPPIRLRDLSDFQGSAWDVLEPVSPLAGEEVVDDGAPRHEDVAPVQVLQQVVAEAPEGLHTHGWARQLTAIITT